MNNNINKNNVNTTGFWDNSNQIWQVDNAADINKSWRSTTDRSCIQFISIEIVEQPSNIANMPKKKPPKNAYYFYMQYYFEQKRREGREIPWVIIDIYSRYLMI